MQQQDDKTLANAGRATISLHDPEAVATWARRLNVTKEQIEEAVRAVGPAADEVELHLKGTRSSTNSDTTKRAGG